MNFLCSFFQFNFFHFIFIKNSSFESISRKKYFRKILMSDSYEISKVVVFNNDESNLIANNSDYKSSFESVL
jgi:hypothetical protein